MNNFSINKFSTFEASRICMHNSSNIFSIIMECRIDKCSSIRVNHFSKRKFKSEKKSMIFKASNLNEGKVWKTWENLNKLFILLVSMLQFSSPYAFNVFFFTFDERDKIKKVTKVHFQDLLSSRICVSRRRKKT